MIYASISRYEIAFSIARSSCVVALADFAINVSSVFKFRAWYTPPNVPLPIGSRISISVDGGTILRCIDDVEDENDDNVGVVKGDDGVVNDNDN